MLGTCDAEMTVRIVLVDARELVFVRHALEASEGLGFISSEKGGELFVLSPLSRSSELDVFLSDMARETGLVVAQSSTGPGVSQAESV